MIVNNSVTIYHQNGLDSITHFAKWKRFNYSNVWFFGGKGAGIEKGYNEANDINVRISYGQNTGLDIANFSIGDIVVAGTLEIDITSEEDLKDYDTYVIKTIKNNTFGQTPHIHIGGK